MGTDGGGGVILTLGGREGNRRSESPAAGQGALAPDWNTMKTEARRERETTTLLPLPPQGINPQLQALGKRPPPQPRPQDATIGRWLFDYTAGFVWGPLTAY